MLKAANQQLQAGEQQLRAANQQLSAINKKIKLNETRFQRAQQIGHVGNWEYDLETNHFWGSEETKRIYGFNESSLNFTINEVENCIPERERVHQALIDLIEEDKPYNLEFEILTRDRGESRTIHSIAALEKDAKGNSLKVTGLIHDITEAKKAKEEIEKLAKFPEENPNPVLRISSDGELLYFNKASHDLLEKWRYFKKKALPDMWVDFSTKCFKNDLIKTTEVKIYKKTILLSFTPITEKGFINVYGLDISTRKESKNKMKTALRKAEESNHLKSAFLANMSHEIRTPMNGILGFLGLLKTQQLSGKDQENYISIIEKSGKRLLSTINDLIEISKIESGQMEIHNAKINLNEKFNDLFAFFKPQVEEKGLQLFLSLPEKEMLIDTDGDKLYAAMVNLIKNAVKYSYEGSIKFGYEKKGNLLEFFVKDTGIGISEDKQKSIFERFVQADPSYSSGFEGVGLGLSIAKSYVEMLGGKIWMDSKEGTGSQFYFTLPYYQSPGTIKADTADSDENKKLSFKTKSTILIVEDEPVSLLYLKVLLENVANKIIEATNGEEAVEYCKNNPNIDLILMDSRIPLMDNTIAMREIRKFNKDVIIIAQTAFAMHGDREKMIALGCNGYISKPIDCNELLNMIKKYLGAH